ncbi:MAG: hypothetical protein LUC90_04305, partial [Lachnospiraceae bacterium]|nr:hypothetical protein [Lachnospiraceae bacterium]
FGTFSLVVYKDIIINGLYAITFFKNVLDVAAFYVIIVFVVMNREHNNPYQSLLLEGTEGRSGVDV